MNQDGNRLDLNELIRKLASLRQRFHRQRNIAMILDLDAELPATPVDAQEIERVLFALFVRSQDAIRKAQREHGTISIRTRVKATRIQCSITDDGLPDLASPISETFFTTSVQEEMNLGMCAAIVQDQGGELYGWRPQGSPATRIIIDLPIHGQPAEGDPSGAEQFVALSAKSR